MFDDVSVAGRHVKRVDERGGLGTVSRLGIAFLASGLEEPLEQLAVLQFGQVDVLAAGLGDLERDPGIAAGKFGEVPTRSEEHTSELQSLMRISYAVFCLKKKKTKQIHY